MANGTFTNLSTNPQTVAVSKTTQSSTGPIAFALFVGLIILGVATGYIVYLGVGQHSASMTAANTGIQNLAKGTVVGSTDTSTFKDTATGTLQNGGISGEGQYHLVRPGGDSQNVYLTSSIVDLSQFIGKNVTVHGQTQAAKYAGWLMDVGQVEVN